MQHRMVQTLGDHRHLGQGVELPEVLATGELINVTMGVLGTHLVIGSDIAPLEHGPERFHAVGVNVAPYVLLDGVLDRFVILQGDVRSGVVRVDLRSRPDVIGNESLKGLALGVVHDLGCNPFRAPILGADYGSLPYGPASREFLPLGITHIASLAAEIRLVHLNRSGHVPDLAEEPLTDALHEIPGRLLRDAQLPVQLHGGNTLQARRHHVDGDGPLLITDLGRLHDHSLTDAEMAPAVPATVGHGLPILGLGGVY